MKMKYYLIYLKNGKVVDITSWDEKDARDQRFDADTWLCTDGVLWNEIQVLDVVY
jgi:hypothetical protein